MFKEIVGRCEDDVSSKRQYQQRNIQIIKRNQNGNSFELKSTRTEMKNSLKGLKYI